MPIAATRMGLEITTKWSKLEKERQIPYGIIHMWNLKKRNDTKRTYIQNRNRFTSIENKFTLASKGEGGEDKLGVWD